MNRTNDDFKRREEEIMAELGMCVGTQAYHRHPSGLLVYTDGVLLMAGRCEAYWLIDSIAFLVPASKAFVSPFFRLWTLSVGEDGRGEIECRSDSGERPGIAQTVEYTDFPLAKLDLYFRDGVLYLPSEH